MIDKITEYLPLVLAIWTAVGIIIRATPTEKDDTKYDELDSKFKKVMRVIEIILIGSKKKK